MSTRSWIRRAVLAGTTAAVASLSLVTPALATPAAPATPSGTESPALTDLLGHIPGQIRSTCTSIKDRAAAASILPAGTLEIVGCSTGDSANSVKVIYISFQDTASLEAAWTKYAPTTTPSQGTCQDGRPGHKGYAQGSSQIAAGEFTCFDNQDGTKALMWTHTDSKILAWVFGPADYAQLYQDWTILGPVPGAASTSSSNPASSV